MTTPSRIDVHHHFNAPGGRSGQPDWSPDKAVAEMDEGGVAFAVGWPGPVAADSVQGARDRARSINEFGADIVHGRYKRFGLFASPPPLTDVDGALREIEYALDVLKANGIGLVTHYQRAWLGDPAFEPVWQELDRRAAVVFVHPQGSGGQCDCGALGYEVEGVSDAWLEYPFNTARTILHLMTTGTLRRFPRIRFIFCHGGGAFTSLIGRLEGFTGWFDFGPERLAQLFPEGIEAEFRRLYFECAQAYSPEQMALLLSRAPASQILFGTDYDRFPIKHAVAQFDRLDLPQDTRAAIEYGNARRLLGL
ncbi:MAG TPA: amidohydrolase family protein [Ramlibacter sp.]|nr:amidohydrolase family protein [Ramlibacter sp.]